MQLKQERIEFGRQVFEYAERGESWTPPGKAAKISVREVVVPNHDADIVFEVHLLDEAGNMLWKWCGEWGWRPWGEDDDPVEAYALAAYLQDRFDCPIEKS